MYDISNYYTILKIMLPSISNIKKIFKENANEGNPRTFRNNVKEGSAGIDEGSSQKLVSDNSGKSAKHRMLTKLSEKHRLSREKHSLPIRPYSDGNIDISDHFSYPGRSHHFIDSKNPSPSLSTKNVQLAKERSQSDNCLVVKKITDEYSSSNDFSSNKGEGEGEESWILYEELHCKNLCSYLSKIVRKSPDILTKEENEEPIDTMNSFWGDSSDNVIPKYYLTNVKEGEMFSIDFFFTIKDSILNLRRLTPYQLEYMKNRASEEEKYEIICLYDKVCNDYYDSLLKTRPQTPA